MTTQAQPQWQFAVGQLLFVVMRQEREVVPVRVVEENRRTVLGGGTRIAYVVQLAGTDESSRIELDPGLHEPFQSADALRAALRARAQAAVDALVDRTTADAARRFPGLEPQVETPEVPRPDPARGDEATLLQLPGGTVVKARIKGPKEVP